MMPLTFSFTPNKSDYIRALRAYYFNNRITLLLLAVTTLISVWTLTVYFLSCYFTTYMLFPLLLAVFMFIFLFFIGPANVGSQVEKNERLHAETTWVVDEERVLIGNRFSETRFDWGTFGRVLETGEHYLLVYAVNNRMFQILPKSAFLSKDMQDDFRKLLVEKGFIIKRARTVRLPEPSAKFLYAFLALFMLVMIVWVVVLNFQGAMYY